MKYEQILLKEKIVSFLTIYNMFRDVDNKLKMLNAFICLSIDGVQIKVVVLHSNRASHSS